MSNDESRRQFEECFRAKYKNDPDFEILLEQHNYGTEEDPDFDYYFLVTRNAWYWWQASRQAIEIDLTDWFSPNDGGDKAVWVDQIEKQLMAKGLKIKGEP